MMLTALFVLSAMIDQPKPANFLTNPNFSAGLSGWSASGHAKAVSDAASLGPGDGAIGQRYEVPGWRILWLGGTVRATAGKAFLLLSCFDSAGHRLMERTAAPDAKHYSSIYLKTPSKTAYVEVGAVHQGPGLASVNDLYLTDESRGVVHGKPTLDLVAAMRPFWKGSRIEDESVLLLSRNGATPSGSLLLAPTKVVSVRDSSLKNTYVAGKDYVVEGRTIKAVAGSSIPTMSDTEFPNDQFPWPRFEGRKVFVTYEHEGAWSEAVPKSQAVRLPGIASRFREHRPIHAVAYGDSITLGVNVSGFRNVPPYLPPWPELATREIARRTGCLVHMENASLGGMTSKWAEDNALDLVGSLKPDLVIIAFGMNDFWSLEPVAYRRHLEAVMATIRSANPRCEFVLVSPMRFDPSYTKDPTYLGRFSAYLGELKAMQGPGVALLDITALSDALVRSKGFESLAADPMHPDDFLGRCHAQALVELLMP